MCPSISRYRTIGLFVFAIFAALSSTSSAQDAVEFANRGNASYEKQDYDKAIADFSEAIRLDPNFVGVYYNRGLAWSVKKEYKKAIDDFDQVIRLDPNFAQAFLERGTAWKATSDPFKSIDDFSQAIKLDPKLVDAYVRRGRVQLEIAKYNQAIADFDEALRLDPSRWAVYVNRGFLRQISNDYEGAVADYNAAILLNPRAENAYYYRSISQLILHRPEATDDFVKTLDLDNGKSLHSAHAVILGCLAARRAGDDAKARMFLDRAALLDASAWPFPVVKFLRGEIDGARLLELAQGDGEQSAAHCYLGLDDLRKGQELDALGHFRLTRTLVDQHIVPSITIEYYIAQAELKRLGDPEAK